MNFHSKITALYKIIYARSEQVLLLFNNYSSGKIVYLWSGKIVVTLAAGWCVLKFLFHTFIQNFGLEVSPCTEEKKNYLSCRTCYSAKQWGNRYSQSLTGSIMTQQHKCHLLSWHFHQEKQDSTWSFCVSLFFLEITVERKRPHL